jgi:hypothetical protein
MIRLYTLSILALLILVLIKVNSKAHLDNALILTTDKPRRIPYIGARV